MICEGVSVSMCGEGRGNVFGEGMGSDVGVGVMVRCELNSLYQCCFSLMFRPVV